MHCEVGVHIIFSIEYYIRCNTVFINTMSQLLINMSTTTVIYPDGLL